MSGACSEGKFGSSAYVSHVSEGMLVGLSAVSDNACATVHYYLFAIAPPHSAPPLYRRRGGRNVVRIPFVVLFNHALVCGVLVLR